MISFYTSQIKNLAIATVWLKHVAAFYNCYSIIVYWQATLLVLLCILEAHWGFYTLKNDLADTLFEILEGLGTW